MALSRIESNYQQLPPSSSSSNSYGQRVYKSRWTRERFRFIILRLILPIILLSIIITLFSISSLNQSSLTLIDQCKDDNCLSWDRLHELAQRIGFDLSVKKLGTQSDQSSCVGPISSKLKILHLINRRTSEVLMDRWMIHSHDAVVKATDFYSSAVLWGPDFKGWQSSKMLTKNIKNQFGSESYFDAVLVYFNNDQVKFLKIDPIP
ncbi:hypothetical protein PPACK8108_LOCUS23226 [Phakopsora pachyrhizi]|uniref:Uncharacterized protein n=1 Tax=Phakopsora pachyrhizi TaxID=170000 RepID=A0AAV0BNQ2_PHAPC|nr:hypothetical protein PPACK8108_LOCUS23226 [Phakopsora pachyrhizi]